MQALRIAAISSLLALGLTLALRAYAEDKADGALRIVLKEVKIAETRADGKPWRSGGGKPDMIVSMRNLSDNAQKEVVTDKKSGFEATYDSAMVLAAAGHRVRILVEDKGLVSNTTIGKTELEITEDMLKKGTTSISFAQVKSLTINFQKP